VGQGHSLAALIKNFLQFTLHSLPGYFIRSERIAPSVSCFNSSALAVSSVHGSASGTQGTWDRIGSDGRAVLASNVLTRKGASRPAGSNDALCSPNAASMKEKD
jgi:hypothetical protein